MTNTTYDEEQETTGLLRRLRGDRGAVGTEMAIVVAIVVAIALTVGGIMTNAARNHADCIPENPTDEGCVDEGG